MRELGMLGIGDLLAVVGGIAVGNGVTIGLFALLGWSRVPPGAGIVELISSFLAVVIGLTIVPALVVLLLAYLSSRQY